MLVLRTLLTRCREQNSLGSETDFWEQVLEKAHSSHKCMACDRAILENQAKAVENYVSPI